MATRWNGRQVEAKVNVAARQAVLIGGTMILNYANQSMRGPKSGRTYQRRGVTHVASAPGEPPAIDNADLVKSGGVSLDAHQPVSRVNWSAEHAAAMEYGTPTIEPRPFARPSLEANKKAIYETFAALLRISLR